MTLLAEWRSRVQRREAARASDCPHSTAVCNDTEIAAAAGWMSTVALLHP
jgi:hypothetical protein